MISRNCLIPAFAALHCDAGLTGGPAQTSEADFPSAKPGPDDARKFQ